VVEKAIVADEAVGVAKGHDEINKLVMSKSHDELNELVVAKGLDIVAKGLHELNELIVAKHHELNELIDNMVIAIDMVSDAIMHVCRH
jgi:hypothetical protein